MGGGGPVIDIERGIRDITGATDMEKRLKKLAKKRLRDLETEADAGMGPSEEDILSVQRQRMRSRFATGRQGTILQRRSTLLGETPAAPRTLLGE